MPHPSPGGRKHCQPLGAVLGLGRVQAHPRDPELWGLQGRGRGFPGGTLRRPQNGVCFPGKCRAKSSAWKGLSSSVKVTFAGDNRCLLRDVRRFGSGVRQAAECCRDVCLGVAGFQTAQCRGDKLGWDRIGLLLCWPWPGVQISCSLLKPQRVGRAGTSCPGTREDAEDPGGCCSNPCRVFFFWARPNCFFPAFATGRACQYHKDASHLDSCTSSVCLSVQATRHQPQPKAEDKAEQNRVMVPGRPQLCRLRCPQAPAGMLLSS